MFQKTFPNDSCLLLPEGATGGRRSRAADREGDTEAGRDGEHEPAVTGRTEQAISMELSSDESCCSTGNNQASDQAGITQLSWQLSSR